MPSPLTVYGIPPIEFGSTPLIEPSISPFQGDTWYLEVPDITGASAVSGAPVGSTSGGAAGCPTPQTVYVDKPVYVDQVRVVEKEIRVPLKRIVRPNSKIWIRNAKDVRNWVAMEMMYVRHPIDPLPSDDEINAMINNQTILDFLSNYRTQNDSGFGSNVQLLVEKEVVDEPEQPYGHIVFPVVIYSEMQNRGAGVVLQPAPWQWRGAGIQVYRHPGCGDCTAIYLDTNPLGSGFKIYNPFLAPDFRGGFRGTPEGSETSRVLHFIDENPANPDPRRSQITLYGGERLFTLNVVTTYTSRQQQEGEVPSENEYLI